jgi:hypothetical protein
VTDEPWWPLEWKKLAMGSRLARCPRHPCVVEIQQSFDKTFTIYIDDGSSRSQVTVVDALEMRTRLMSLASASPGSATDPGT